MPVSQTLIPAGALPPLPPALGVPAVLLVPAVDVLPPIGICVPPVLGVPAEPGLVPAVLPLPPLPSLSFSSSPPEAQATPRAQNAKMVPSVSELFRFIFSPMIWFATRLEPAAGQCLALSRTPGSGGLDTLFYEAREGVGRRLIRREATVTPRSRFALMN
jgi:hypothetical protein